MSIQWQFKIDELEIEEPVGFNDIVFNILRDDHWHGVMFEASTSSLKFYGEAFDYLQEKKEGYGVNANVIFKALSRCNDEEDFETALEGKLNFARYGESCGSDCFVSLPVEQANCTMILKNRFDQKVSVDSQIAFDKITVLADYTGIGLTMELATQDIPITADASVAVAGDGGVLGASGNGCFLFMRPVYEIVRDASIKTSQLDNPSNFYQDCDMTFLLSPQVLIEEIAECLPPTIPYQIGYHTWDYTVRLKGTLKMDIIVEAAAVTKQAYLILSYWDGNGELIGDKVTIDDALISSNMLDGVIYSFDETFTGTAVIPAGVGVYAYIVFDYPQNGFPNMGYAITYNFEEETSFFLGTTKQCPPSDCTVYLVNETLSRITESITNVCLTVKSDYYGRTDSQPYTSEVDGCGSLRVLTSGLKIRQAVDKEFFASLKDVLEGLKAIDNIGMGIEGNRLRIEPVKYFYNETQILTLDLIPAAQKQIVENLIYSIIKTGYKKWEIKSVKGIDEFNSTKEFRTSITSVSRTLDITTDLIASGYIIEQLRTSTLANTGNADSTYDNDIFIICVTKAGYGYIVEQNVAANVTNVFSPATAYNWRIRPLYNLMRWAKSIFPAYPVLSNSASKIFFTNGTGNYLASGNLTDDCREENKALAENTDITVNDFDDPLVPIWEPEEIVFDYPLSIRDYNLIKANPYGYIYLQCGTGDFIKAYIKSVQYKVAEGKANFTLLLKWQ